MVQPMVVYSAGRAVARRYPAIRYASYARRYGPSVARAGYKIAKWGYKRWRSRASGRAAKRRRTEASDKAFLGDTRHCHNQTGSLLSTIAPGQLNCLQLSTVDRGSLKSETMRGKYIIKGLKMCAWFRNTSTDHELLCRWQIVEPKYPGDMGSTVRQTIPLFTTSNLTDGARTSSFNEPRTGIEAGDPCRDRYCLPLNKGYWRTYAGGRFRLAPNNENGNNKQRMQRLVKRYIKMNMKIEQPSADETGVLNSSRKLFYFFWVENFEDTPSTAVQYEANFATYFKQGN